MKAPTPKTIENLPLLDRDVNMYSVSGLLVTSSDPVADYKKYKKIYNFDQKLSKAIVDNMLRRGFNEFEGIENGN